MFGVSRGGRNTESGRGLSLEDSENVKGPEVSSHPALSQMLSALHSIFPEGSPGLCFSLRGRVKGAQQPFHRAQLGR